jgi:hypothetical protein
MPSRLSSGVRSSAIRSAATLVVILSSRAILKTLAEVRVGAGGTLGGANVMGMTAVGVIWMLLTVVVVVALIVVLVRRVSRV